MAVARSVQRLPLPPGKSAEWVAAEYMRWLPRLRVLRVDVTPARVCRFYLAPLSTPLLELTFAEERSTPDRQLFYVSGGLLARLGDRSRLEFRETGDRQSVLAAVHDFSPRLPWLLYTRTQAVAHVEVMSAFGEHLARLASAAIGVRQSAAAQFWTSR